MPSVTLRFYGPLNDFLEPALRQRDVEAELQSRTGIKDLIESFGVPHPEVGLILVDQSPVSFAFVLEKAARIAVYPELRVVDAAGASLVALPPLTELRFVVDGHLGRLAAYLRALGFDVSYERLADDPTLARVSADEERVLLTRDVGLLKRGIVRRGRWVRATLPERQLAELAEIFPLADQARPFSRCVACNEMLEPRTRESVQHRVPERSLRAYDEFSECPGCHRVYWPGTHYEKLMSLFARTGALTNAAPGRGPTPGPAPCGR